MPTLYDEPSDSKHVEDILKIKHFCKKGAFCSFVLDDYTDKAVISVPGNNN